MRDLTRQQGRGARRLGSRLAPHPVETVHHRSEIRDLEADEWRIVIGPPGPREGETVKLLENVLVLID
eukprot:2200520-Pyramimonas_sp.AAC.1